MEQHDNHIWMTVNGEGWAIRCIERDHTGHPALMHLWRGYFPLLSACTVDVSKVDWDGYVDKAVAMLEEAYGS